MRWVLKRPPACAPDSLQNHDMLVLIRHGRIVHVLERCAAGILLIPLAVTIWVDIACIKRIPKMSTHDSSRLRTTVVGFFACSGELNLLNCSHRKPLFSATWHRIVKLSMIGLLGYFDDMFL